MESIDGLGKKGAVVKVKDGFARNFLLPYHRAMPVTPDNLYRLVSLQKKFAEEEARLVQELSAKAKGLEGLTLTMVVKATEEGHLFGSVSQHMIAEELLAQGFQVAERGIKIGEAIKSVGTYPITVHLHSEVSANITVVVDREGGMPEPEEAPAPEGEEGQEGAEGTQAAAEGEAGETAAESEAGA